MSASEVRTSILIEQIAERVGQKKEIVAGIYDELVNLISEYSKQEKTIILKNLVRIYPYRTKEKQFYNCKKKQMETTRSRLSYKARMSDSFNRKMWNNEEIDNKIAAETSE